MRLFVCWISSTLVNWTIIPLLIIVYPRQTKFTVVCFIICENQKYQSVTNVLQWKKGKEWSRSIYIQVAQRATIAHLRANFTFSYCKSMGDDDPRGLANLDPRGMIGRIYVGYQ